MTELDLAYCGGLFDGEGSAGVYIIKRRRYDNKRPDNGMEYMTIHPTVQLRMLDADPVRTMYETFGGWFGTSNTPSRQKLGRRGPVYEWRSTHRKALEVANILMPWCRNAAKQVQLQKIISHYDSWVRPKRGEKRYWDVSRSAKPDQKPDGN